MPIVISVVTTGASKMSAYEITIGKLSDHTGVKVETIRYYEKIGLMPQAPRKQSGHRVYNNDLADRLKFIKRGRELGFSLDDIRALLGLGDRKPTCRKVYRITSAHLDVVRKKIEDLKKLEKTLSGVAKKCDRNETPDCAIIKTLFS